MTLLGLHHISIGCKNAQHTVDFYTNILGQRFVKKTVNFDDPSTYHLYFGNHQGDPGSAITFFEWPLAVKGHRGIGGTHHFALRIPTYDGLLKWKRRLLDLGLKVSGPLDRHYFVSIYFTDPDGTIVEIATDGPGFTQDEPASTLGTQHQPPPPQMLIANRDEKQISAEIWQFPTPNITQDMALLNGFHHITAICSDVRRTDAFFQELLGLRRVKMTDNFDDPNSAHWYWGVGEGNPGSLITYFEQDLASNSRARHGVGQTHHYAFRVANKEIQLEWREKLLSAGLQVSPVMDRNYFNSIYTNDPDGHVVEIATDTPGFMVDESEAELGQSLKLPSQFEAHREQIESTLTQINVTPWQFPGKS
ncbi:MAG: VOC family protein [Chloroflexota bacterium]